MNIPRKYTVSCLLAISCLVFACSNLTRSDKPATTTWWLQPYEGVSMLAVPDQVLPVFLSVTAVPGLDSDQVLTLSSGAELKPYAGARWADYLPELTASLIGRSLEASGRFKLVSGRSANGPQSCELKLELTEFFAKLDSNGLTSGVNVALKGRYRCGSASTVDFQSSATVSVAGERMNVIVAAFQRALDRVTMDVLEKI